MTDYDDEGLHYLAASADSSPVAALPPDLGVVDSEVDAVASVRSPAPRSERRGWRAPYPSVYLLAGFEHDSAL